MSISRDDVEHIAELARIRLDEEELETFREDLSDILEYVEQLEELDTSSVEATTHAVPLETKGREDDADDGLEREAVLSNTPDVEDGQFRVPRVVDE